MKFLKKENLCIYISVVICIGAAVFMFIFADAQSFNVDELFNIGIVGKTRSFGQMLYDYLTVEVNNPPLYAIFLYIWYRLAPYGEQWLLLPNIVFFAIAVLALSKLAFACTGKKISVFITVSFSAMNVFIINNVVWELRNYAMMFMFSSLVMLYYYKVKKNDSIKNILVLGVFMLLLVYSHYFGALFAVLLAVCDLLLFIMKKCRFRCIASYLICGIGLAPFFIAMLCMKSNDLAGSFWPEVPGLISVIILLVTVMGNKFGALIFCAAIITAVIDLTGKIKKKDISEENITAAAALFAVCAMIVLIFIYSRYINPKASVWVMRYFVSVIPCMIFITAYGISKINIPEWIIMVLIPLVLIGGSCSNLYKLTYGDSTITQDGSDERGGAEYLEKNASDKDLIISTDGGFTLAGWKEYYITKKLNIVAQDDFTSAGENQNVYVFSPHTKVKENVIKGLAGFENVKDTGINGLKKYRR